MGAVLGVPGDAPAPTLAVLRCVLCCVRPLQSSVDLQGASSPRAAGAVTVFVTVGCGLPFPDPTGRVRVWVSSGEASGGLAPVLLDAPAFMMHPGLPGSVIHNVSVEVGGVAGADGAWCFARRAVVIKLGDFGTARSLSATTMVASMAGNVFCQAPEVNMDGYSPAADVFAWAVSMCWVVMQASGVCGVWVV